MKKLFLMLLIGTMVSCTSQNDPSIKNPKNAQPIKLTVEQQQKVGRDNAFAFDLLKNSEAVTGETNLFISPLSVSIALGMVWNGANGQTKTEIENALKMNGMTVDDINTYYKIMQSKLPEIDPTTKLSIANSLWYITGFPVKQSFLTVNQTYFDAYVKEIDFTQSWALDTINNWCAQKTNNLIQKPLKNIPADMVMYLINAVYFKGIWVKQFDKKNTFEANFTNEANETVPVNMMCLKDTFAYAEDDKAQYLDLPYGNKAFSMTVILPAEGVSATDYLNNYLTTDRWNAALNAMTTTKIDVYLPRFKNENDLELKPVMQRMGMNLSFTDNADFTGIADMRLYISTIIHDTYVEVTEDGTEAAAVTIIGVGTTSMPLDPVFTVNKPFLFVIREKSTGVILFAGKMGNVRKY